VVIMALVPADVAGVAFTANPITGSGDQIVVNASWGLGEIVVSGRVTPDSFVLDKESLTPVERDVFPKEVEIVPDPAGGSGVVSRPVEGGRAMTPALTEPQLRELGALCLAVERHYERPMDIEWAFAANRLSLLQARPITALG
jgi:rifampicin phosphotransferase